jgi:hypothetical protein
MVIGFERSCINKVHARAKRNIRPKNTYPLANTAVPTKNAQNVWVKSD